MTISLSGQITNGTVSDVSNIKPFGTLKLNDTFSTDAVSATISFLTVNGTLSGTWLSSGVTSGANITYTLSATNPAQLQQELNALVFSPTPHQVAVNTTVQTHFTLNISAGLAGAGLTPSQTFQFGTSNSLVVDASGNMYTTNATGNNVNEYSAAGLLLNQLSPTNGINNPQTLAIDASGDLFVANGGTSNTVTEYSSAGTLLRTLATGISSPSNLATDASGDVFVANNGNATVTEYSASGSLLHTIQTSASANKPLFLTTDTSGNVFVANYTNSSVTEYSSAGTLVRTLSMSLSGISPVSMATDNNGDLFVGTYQGVVAEYSSTGTLLRTINAGVNYGYISSLATDKSGDIYCALNNSNTVTEYSASGTLLRTLNTSGGILSTDAAGNLYVAGSSSTQKYSPIPPVTSLNNTTTTVTTTAAAITAPTITTGTGSSFVSGRSVFVSGLAVNDASAGSATVSVNISDKTGLLNTTATTGLSVTGANTNNLTLSGSVNAVNTALTNLVDANSSVGSDNLTISYTDTAAGTHATASMTETVVAAVTLGGLTTNGAISDMATFKPFSATVLTDNVSTADNLSASISFTAANGTLSGTGLSVGTSSAGVISYSLSAVSQATLQQELNGLIFTPTTHQVASGSTVTTNFTLNVSGVGSNNSPASSVTLSGSVNALATDARGDVFVSTSTTATITEYSASGAVLQTLSGGSSNYINVVTDINDNVYVSSVDISSYPYSASIKEFSASGALLNTINLSSSSNAAYLMTTDLSGNLFVANSGTVTEYSASGILVQTITPPNLYTLSAITTDAKGDIFIASSSANNTVVEYSASGVSLHTITSGISSPTAIATDASGNLFVANSGSNTVTEYSSGGISLNTISTGISNSSSLATDINGDVYVANNNNTVTEYSASGTLLRTLNTSGLLSTDAIGNLYVASTNYNGSYTGGIQKYAPIPTINSVTDSSTKVTVTAAVITAPTVNVGNAQSVALGQPTAISGLSITDLFASNSSVTAVITDSKGLFNATAATGLSLSGNGTKSLSLTGTLSVVNAALATLTETNNTLGSDTITIVATDMGTNKTGSNSLSVTVASAPVVNVSSTQTLIANTPTTLNGISLTDTSAGSSIITAVVSDSYGLLSANTATGLTQTGSGTNHLTLSGSLAVVNAALATLKDADSVTGTDTLTIQATDTGTQLNATGTQNVTVSAISFSGQTTNGTSLDISTFKPFSSLALNDAFGSDLVSASISYTAANGSLSGTGLSIGSMSGSIITYTLSAATPVQLQLELSALVFTPHLHQVAAGATVTTNFSLSVNGGLAGAGATPIYSLSPMSGAGNGLATDASGDVFVLGSGVTEYSSTGNLLRTITVTSQNIYGNSKDITTDASGDVFVANPSANTVTEFSPLGVLLRTITNGSSNSSTSVDYVTTDLNGDLFAANHGGSVNEYSSSGALIRTFTNGTAMSNGTVVATDHSGNVFVANLYGGSISEYSASGALTQTITKGMSSLYSLVTDASGDLFVGNSDTVTEYSASGVLLRTISNGISYPSDLATDASGNLYVANGNNSNTVTEYSASGTLLRTINTTSNGNTSNLATDSLGNVYIYNSSNGNVQKFSANPIASTVTDNSTKVTVTAAAITQPTINVGSAHSIYAGAQSLITDISIVDPSAGSSNVTATFTDLKGLLNVAALKGLIINGANTTTLGLTGSVATINAAISALIDNNSSNGTDNIIVSYSDSASSTSKTGLVGVTVSTPISMTGVTTNGQLVDTGSLNPFANVVITDTIANEVLSATITFNADNGILTGNALSYGSYDNNNNVSYTLSATSLATLQSELNALTFTPTQAASSTTSTAFTLNLSDGGAATWTISSGLAPTGSGLNVKSPSVLATNAQGDVYIAELGNNRVQEYSANGQLIGTLSTGILAPSAIVTDAKGDVFVANGPSQNPLTGVYTSTNTVEEFSAGGTLLHVLHNGVVNPTSIATDVNGDVFVANGYATNQNGYIYNTPNSVEEFSASGALLRTLTTGINTPVGVVTDGNGDVFVANSQINYVNGAYSATVEEFSSSGTLINTLNIQLPTYNYGSILGVGAINPATENLATDKWGDIYAAYSGSNTVQEYSANGTLINTLSIGISSPSSLSTDNNGNLYVTNAGNNTVEEFSVGGTLLRTISTGMNNPNDVVTDSNGNVFVANAGQYGLLSGTQNVEKFSAYVVPATATNGSTLVTASPTKTIDASGLGTVATPDTLSGVLHGDTISINDATSFQAAVITSANMIAAGGKSGSTNLADWVNGALQVKGADLAQHQIAWFDLNGNTYLVEQAHTAGTALTTGDTLVQLTGVALNETGAVFSGHSVIL